MDSYIIFIAKYLIYIAVCVFLTLSIILISRGQKDYILKLFVAGLLAVLLAKIAAKLYFDPRPFVVSQTPPLIPHSPENGFPSSHALAGMLMGMAVWKYYRKWAVLLIILAGCIGVARVFARVHHAQDIIGATVIAVVAVITADVIVTHSYIMRSGTKEKNGTLTRHRD